MDAKHNQIWKDLVEDVKKMSSNEPLLVEYLNTKVLSHNSLQESLSFILAAKLATEFLKFEPMQKMICEALQTDDIIDSVAHDLEAVRDRDPAAESLAEPFLYFKGFQAIQSYRVAHWLWIHKRKDMALYLQSRMSEVYSMDVHPAAKIGKGILVDHGTGVVIGETSVVGDNVSLLHEVTLGGTGKESGDRHPKVGSGVLIGAGSKILGNVKIGEGVKIGASSVVLTDIPPHTTAVGVPAKVVGHPCCESPSLKMNQTIDKDCMNNHYSML